MPYFRVLLDGENIWLHMEGRQQRMGFFTTRFVEAASMDEARKVAVSHFHSEKKLKSLNPPDDPPRVIVREVERVKKTEVPRIVHGFAFFPEEPENSIK